MERCINTLERALAVIDSPIFTLLRSKAHTVLISAIMLRFFVDDAKLSVSEDEILKVIRESKLGLDESYLEEVSTKKSEVDLLDVWCRNFKFLKKVKKEERYEIELTSNGHLLINFLRSLENRSTVTLDGDLVENLLTKTKELELLLTEDPKEKVSYYKEQIKLLKYKINEIEERDEVQSVSHQRLRKEVSDLLYNANEINRLLTQAGESFYEHSVELRNDYETKLEADSLDAIEELKQALMKHDNFLKGEVGKAFQSFNISLNRKNTMIDFSSRIKRIFSNKDVKESLKETSLLNEAKSLSKNISELNGRIFKRKKDLNSSLSNFFDNMVNSDYLRKSRLIKEIEELLIKSENLPLFNALPTRKIENFYQRNLYSPKEEIEILPVERHETKEKSVNLEVIDRKKVEELVHSLPEEVHLKEILEKVKHLSSKEFIFLQSFFSPIQNENQNIRKQMDENIWYFQNVKLKKRSQL
ncbi:MAG: hypothetical protein CME60_08730 [Halobacteriovoraceae bacterium]|nr:hypothetical protein [Halobacteriovoraceae bacterium]